ncbi:MAG TPA: sensor domain-containing protein, partial [Candidatus Eisenbacteria bacterium]|nr:sensor domain-containing protein [Candidatus Eisenbacteria bacterium]
MIGSAVLVTGLLLILAGLAAARIPGGATFARPGISRSSGPSRLSRAFILSPIHPATWYANAAIGLGFFIGILAFGLVAALASTGLTVLLAGIGVFLIAAAIEASRGAARIERWRVFIGKPDRPASHPYKPLRGSGVLGLLRAEFTDESRWRDVLYVGVNLPLAVIEF